MGSAPANAAAMGNTDRRVAPVVWAVLAGAFALGVGRAIAIAWLSDDSFISLRYALNLADGLGLVYNAGERVEGYTNLLWTLGLAAASVAGLSAVSVARYAGVLCYVALGLVLASDSRRRAREESRPFLPLAAVLVLLSDDFHIWATGGLETMLFAYLATHGLVLSRSSDPSRARWVGLLFSLLILTRPDGALIAAVGVASYWLPTGRFPARERLACAIAVAAPVAVTLGGLALFKLGYYGELLPTAFYSKSVLTPYPTQGLVYVGLLLARSWYLLPLLALAAWAARRARPSGGRGDVILFAAAAALFTTYLIVVGGDFMHARRLVPVLPIVLLAAERCIVALPIRTAQAASLAACLAAVLPLPLYEDASGAIHGVFDERRSYPQETIDLRRLQAETVAQALADIDVRAGFEGGMCVFGFYSALPYLAEMTGLTQYSLARRPLEERGVPGHEKRPDAQWLEANDIHLLFKQELPPVRPTPEAALDEIRFGDVARAQIVRYDAEIMDSLRGRPGVEFVPIEQVLVHSAEALATLPVGAAEGLLAELDRYYFRGAGPGGEPDAQRLRAIVEERRRGQADRQPADGTS